MKSWLASTSCRITSGIVLDVRCARCCIWSRRNGTSNGRIRLSNAAHDDDGPTSCLRLVTILRTSAGALPSLRLLAQNFPLQHQSHCLNKCAPVQGVLPLGSYGGMGCELISALFCHHLQPILLLHNSNRGERTSNSAHVRHLASFERRPTADDILHGPARHGTSTVDWHAPRSGFSTGILSIYSLMIRLYPPFGA